MTLRLLRYGALVLALAGTGLLYLMAINREVPTVKVADIAPTMNYAYVRIAGVVGQSAGVYRKQGMVEHVSFSLNDGSGSIPVSAYGARARALVDAGLLPRRGDRVEVAGSLSVQASGKQRLHLETAAHLRIEARTRGGPDASSPAGLSRDGADDT